jgi:hypothetical protein
MAAIPEKYINEWDMNSWHTRVETSKGAALISGALFAHTDPSKVYLMTESAGPSVRFELNRADIEEASELGESVKFADRSFSGVQIELKLNAIVTRVSVHLATGLVEYPDHSISALSGETMKIKNTVLANVLMR